jgi:transposase-like protein
VTIFGMATDDREASTSALVDTCLAGTRRRRWPEAVKRQMVAETFEPAASVSIVARRHDVNANQLFKWRRQFAASSCGTLKEPVRLLSVEIAAPPAPMSAPSVSDGAPGASKPPAAAAATAPPTASARALSGSIEITLSHGVRVRIKGAVDPTAVSAAVGAVMAARRRR